MAVYVDALFPTRPYRQRGWRWQQACHMWADTIPELHQFAKRIGLRRGWFQADQRFPHYDLTASKRAEAIRAGAVVSNLRDHIRKQRRRAALSGPA